MVEAIIQEDNNERMARHTKEAEIKGYIETFIKEQEAYKKIRVDEIEAENAKIREYATQVMEREQALRAEKQREQNAKDAILERMKADMTKRQKEADEMENLRNGASTARRRRALTHAALTPTLTRRRRD